MLSVLGNPALLLAAEGGGGVEFPPISLIVKLAAAAFGGRPVMRWQDRPDPAPMIQMLVPVILFWLAGAKAGWSPRESRT